MEKLTRSRLVTGFVGLVLLAAGGLKLLGLSVAALPSEGWFAQPRIQMLVFRWEILLGAWLLTGLAQAWAWRFALLTFIAFAGTSSYLGWQGVASCSCFGPLKTSPWVAFGVDLAVLALLALGMPPRQQANPSSSRWGWVAAGVGVAVSLLVAGIAVLAYGSLHLAYARLTGEGVTVAAPYLDFGTVPAGTKQQRPITLRNWTNADVRLIGGTKECACAVAQTLPATIKANESLQLPIDFIMPPDASGVFERPIVLWTDCDRSRTVRFSIGGVLVAQHEPSPKKY